MKRLLWTLTCTFLFTTPLLAQSDGEDHLDGAFRTQNFTWDDSYLPTIEFKYNNANVPQGQTFGHMENLIEEAMDKWDYVSSLHRVRFDKDSPFSTDDKYAPDSENIIYWKNQVASVQAEVEHYPDQDPGQGPKSEEGADIYFNYNSGVNWYFGSSPPGGRSSSQYGYDFVETLMHEFGHVLGLRHTQSSVQDALMQEDYDDRTISLRGFSNGDRAGAVYQHPVLSITSLPLYDLALTAETNDVEVTADVTLNRLVDVEHNTLVLDSGTRKLTVSSNGELLIRDTGTVRGGKIVVASGGVLRVQNGGLLDDSDITVESGGTFIAEGGTIQRGDINVSSGGTLQTNGTPTFKFDASSNIFSRGLLEIDGGTFEPYGSNTWLYIYLLDSGADGSSIENATIDGIYYGIHTNNIDGLTIDDVTATNSALHGIKVVSSQSVTIKNSVVEHSGTDGVYIDGSDVVILDSHFESNDGDGVRVRGASNADFGLQNSDHPSVLTDNLRGLNAYNSSYATLGDMTVNGNNFGTSSCYDNTYNARTADSGVILAEETWWGDDPPNTSLFDEGGGVIIYGNWLTSPVVTRMDAAPVFAQPDVLSDVTTGMALQRAEVNVPAPAATSLQGGDLSELAPAEFVRRMRRLLSQDAGAAAALLDQVRRGPISRNQRLATLFYVQHQAREGRLAAAEAVAKTALDASDLAVWERAFVLKQLFYAHLDAGHYGEASELLSTLTALEEDDAKSGLLAAVFEEVAGRKPVLKQEAPADADAASPVLTTAPTIETEHYPNPFNPTTTIRYTLPEEAFVTLRVFDVLGREVAELVHARQAAGAHQATFDASGLPSGLYVYRLDVGGHALHGDMLLSK